VIAKTADRVCNRLVTDFTGGHQSTAVFLSTPKPEKKNLRDYDFDQELIHPSTPHVGTASEHLSVPLLCLPTQDSDGTQAEGLLNRQGIYP
jgi:hypothetical protein